MTRSLLSRASELQQRGLALERKSREHTNFCEYVVALLEMHRAERVCDLPMEDQHAVAERGMRLTPASELESESAELERLGQELFAQLPPDFFVGIADS
jgi:hypothetical protein